MAADEITGTLTSRPPGDRLAGGTVLNPLTDRADAARITLLFFPMWLLSGAGPPPSIMTDTMRQLSDVLPLTHVVHAIQKPWLGTGSNTSELILLIALFAIAAAISAWRNADRFAGSPMLHRRAARTSPSLS